MSTRHKHRARILAVLMVICVLSTLSIPTHADSWKGARYDGSNFNGYWIAPSGVGYRESIDNAYDVWRQACNASGNLEVRKLGLRIVSTGGAYRRGQDIVTFIQEDTRTPSDELTGGYTDLYKEGEGGKLVLNKDELKIRKDADWYCCKIVVNAKTVQDFGNQLSFVLVHEVGHTLKMGHPPQGALVQTVNGPVQETYEKGKKGHVDGDGTSKYGTNVSVGTGYSVMARHATSDTLSDYDKNELRNKWGRP